MLPNHYRNNSTYYRDSFTFLNEFQWIFIELNTKYLRAKVLDQIPVEWIKPLLAMTTEELNMFPFGYISETFPGTLKYFLERLKLLTPTSENNQEEFKINHFQSIRGVNPKKLHEIHHLSSKIDAICSKDHIKLLVDLGSGLGYLSQYLNENYGYKILCLETDKNRVKAAISRQHKYFQTSIGQVIYVSHFITDQSNEFIQDQLKKYFKIKNASEITLMGLHACADLTITAINLFHSMECVKKLIIMPCCYHKMEQINENLMQPFKNFPLSQSMKNSLIATIPEGNQLIINRPFLRLACQQTASRWEKMTFKDHNKNGRNMFQRAIIDDIMADDKDDGHIILKKKYDLNECSDDFSFESTTNKYEILCKSTKLKIDWNENHKTKFNNIVSKYPNGAALSEIVVAFQTAIQALCENLVLLDKLSYIAELSPQYKSMFQKIVNDEMSPRCFVLIVDK